MTTQITVRKVTSGNNCKDGDRLTPAENADKSQVTANTKVDRCLNEIDRHKQFKRNRSR